MFNMEPFTKEEGRREKGKGRMRKEEGKMRQVETYISMVR
jgi:hypothetical protein